MREEPAKIVFLDDNEDLRDLMPVLLEPAFGVKCLCFGSLLEFDNHREEILQAKVAILDINLGPDAPDGIDALNWLRERGFAGKILFFTGHARTNPHVSSAEANGVEILEKPIRPDKLMASIARALDGKP